MVTQQAVETSLKPERVQEPFATGAAALTAGGLVIQLKAERVQEPTLAAAGATVTYTYELAVNQPQVVEIELPMAIVTLLGSPAWGAPEVVPAAGCPAGKEENNA